MVSKCHRSLLAPEGDTRSQAWPASREGREKPPAACLRPFTYNGFTLQRQSRFRKKQPVIHGHSLLSDMSPESHAPDSKGPICVLCRHLSKQLSGQRDKQKHPSPGHQKAILHLTFPPAQTERVGSTSGEALGDNLSGDESKGRAGCGIGLT